MDPLFPGCDKYIIPSKFERVRPVSSGRQGRSKSATNFLESSHTDELYFNLEPNARRNDNMGFNMPLTMVQANINRESLSPHKGPRPINH